MDPRDRFIGRSGSLPVILDPAARAEMAAESMALLQSCRSSIVGWNTKRLLDMARVEPPGVAVAWPPDRAIEQAPSQVVGWLRGTFGRDTMVLGGLETFKAFAKLCDQIIIFRAALDASAGTGKSLFLPDGIA